MTVSGSFARPQVLPPSVGVRSLLELSAHGLPAMFDSSRRLFCFTSRRTPGGVRREGHSHRYSVMSLLGLHRLQVTCDLTTAVPLADAARYLLQQRDWVRNAGDLGLLLWLCATVAPAELRAFVSQAQVGTALSRYPSTHTMELAWLLTGIAYASKVEPRAIATDLTALAVTVRDRVLANQGPHGFFGHQAASSGATGWLRGHVGSFADQVYPIYALARFGEFLGDATALESARRCADAICGTQGPMGQWWWHFDAERGRVAQRCPVYAVHQEGMAPMALFAVQQATGVSYRKAVYAGLEWLVRNELGRDLREPQLGLVWRDIEVAPRWLGQVVAAREYIGVDGPVSPSRLRVNEECRPYELGWLLYAFAGEASANAPSAAC